MNALRALRRTLGSRSQRRSGTKTKAILGAQQGAGGALPKYRFPHQSKMCPAARIRAAIRKGVDVTEG